MTRLPLPFRLLLRFYPAAFREEFGREMQLMFARQLDQARHGGAGEQAVLWRDAAMDAIIIGPREHWHVIVQDIRYALRALAAQPGFASVAILSLALGIGASTAIFSLWNGMLHAPLPGVRHAEQLVILTNPQAAGGWHGDTEGDRDWMTWEEFEQLRDHAGSFSAMAASQSYLDGWVVRIGGGDWEEAQGRLVSGGYFDLFGVRPAAGRAFTSADDHTDSPGAVISYNYWQQRFGGRLDVLGKSITVRHAALTIIGVAPRGFVGETAGQQPDLWVPVRMQPAVLPGENWLHDTPPEKAMWLHVFGRLRPGVTPARAEAEANAIFRGGLESFYGAASPDRRRELLDQRLKIRPAVGGASETRADFSASLSVLLAAVGVLLLIACANLANLLLARAAVRKAEMALRISLGAGRGRLIRQLVTESLVLAAMGSVCGLGVAALVHGALVGMIARSDQHFVMSFALDPMMLAFTLALTVAAALLFGLLPAFQATQTDAADALKEQSRGSAGSMGRLRLGRSLVSLQLALSLPLLAGAGLLARTVYNLQHVDLGYRADHLKVVGVNARVAGYNSARSTTLFLDLLDRIQRLPGVTAATFSHNGLFTGTNSADEVEVEGYTRKGKNDKGVSWDMVGPRYFSTLGIPMLRGREILQSDQAGSARVCVINEAFARQFFAGRNPAGMHLAVVDDSRRTVYQVVGVARNARTSGLRDKTFGPRFYVPVTQPAGDNVKRANFLIRTAADSTAVLGAVRKAFHQADALLPIGYARSMDEQLLPWTASERTTAQVAAVFGCVALLLAAIGLYGVLSYGIARRRGEVAVRIALGAEPGQVISMVLRETAVLVAAGLIIGGGLTWGASRLIASQLFGVVPRDPLTLSMAVALLLAVAFSAVYLPARRASRMDPMAALRQE